MDSLHDGSLVQDVELPALFRRTLGLELLLAFSAVREDPAAGIGALLRTLSIPLERRVLFGPPPLLLVVEGVEFLRGRCSSDALFALQLEQDVFASQFIVPHLQLLVLGPASELLRRIHRLEAENIRVHDRLPVNNPFLGETALAGSQLVPCRIPFPDLFRRDQPLFLQAFQLL